MDKYISELISLIKNNDNWKTLLKENPYNLKTIKECSWHKNWFMFVYNLFDSDLSNYVVRACRGTVLEINGKDVKVISYPYSKFDNYGSASCKDIEEQIDWSKAVMPLKVDGILIKTAKVDDRLYFFTNGSFDLNAPFEDSLVFDEPETRGAEVYGDLLAYAIKKGSKNVEVFFNKENGEFYCKGSFVNEVPEGSTFMFELTSPRNKIICNYQETKLWWHGFRDENLEEKDPRKMKPFSDFDFEIPPLLDANNLDDLKTIISSFKGDEKEGVVITDYSASPVARSKIKCEDYLRNKFARDAASNDYIIFKAVVFDEYDDLMAAVPATIPKIEQIKSELETFYSWYLNAIEEAKKFENKKDYALFYKNKSKDSFSFRMKAFEDDETLARCKNLLMFKACQKKGYEFFKKVLGEINGE